MGAAGIYMFKIKSRNTRTNCEICPKLTIKEEEYWEGCQDIHLDRNVEGAFKSLNPILFKKSDYLDKYIEFFQLFYQWC